MITRNASLYKSVDWVIIALYLVLVICGWFSVCGASYTYGEPDFFGPDTRAGKQMMWIGCALGVGFVLLMLEKKLYELLAYFIYGAVILLLILTLFVAPDIKGSHSWLRLGGGVNLQPAEFAKAATALALAKYMNNYSFSLHRTRDFLVVMALIFLPMGIIVLQKETGSALVFLSFFLMLYREGMSGAVLFSGVCAVVFFIVGIRFSDITLWNMPTPVGKFVVMLLIQICTAGMVGVYTRRKPLAWWLFGGSLGLTLLTLLFSGYVIPFDITWVQLGICGLMVAVLCYLWLRERINNFVYIALFTLGSLAFFYSSDFVFAQVLQPHQKVRIEVVLGMKEDLSGAGYNVNQSKIAIGSGGLTGKGFLNGTQTKLKYVPEQDTDFIFCTVGEEQGFIGSSAVLLLFLAFILRLLVLAERQTDRFGRVYGYSLVGIFLFHLFINVGMVLGLTPVIGIPLPFFSYGGSSLWGFTILLFIFIRIDAARKSTPSGSTGSIA